MQQAAPTAYRRDQAEEYDDLRFSHPAGQRTHRAEFRLLCWALDQVGRDERVLEVGCGTGRLLLAARGLGYAIEGADASPEMLSMLRKKLSDDADAVPLEVAEAAHLPHDDDTFGLVYAIRLLNQTESPAYALSAVREMVRVTRPGGLTLVEFINHYRPRWGKARRPTTRLRPAEVAAAAREAGAAVVGTRGAFLLGMQTMNATPAPLLWLTDGLDRGLSRLLPRLCSRVYMLLRKAAST